MVLPTCLVLSLPSEMGITVFHNLADNETRDWDGIGRSPGLQTVLLCHWCQDSAEKSRGMLAHRHFRWIENIPNVPSANFSFFLLVVPSGSHHSLASRLSITEMSSQSRPCVYIQRPACSEQTAGIATVVLLGSNHTTPTTVFFPILTFLMVLPLRSPAAQSLWEAMLTSKQKEGVMEVRRQLVEAASKEKLPIKMSMGKMQTSHLISPRETQIHTKYRN